MDTRNVVEVLIYVFVMDIQDTPPFFVKAPPITAVSDKLEIVIPYKNAYVAYTKIISFF